MPKDYTDPREATASTPPRGRSLPSGHRALYVAVPEQAFNHAKAQAYLSGMPWKEYIRRLLAEARPYGDGTAQPANS